MKLSHCCIDDCDYSENYVMGHGSEWMEGETLDFIRKTMFVIFDFFFFNFICDLRKLAIRTKFRKYCDAMLMDWHHDVHESEANIYTRNSS